MSTLPNLQGLSIDFSLSGVVTEQFLLKQIFKHLCIQPTLPSLTSLAVNHSSVASGSLHRITSLTLTALPYIDKALLALIANNLPTLTILYLCCTDRLDLGCCWDCFEDSAGRTIGMFPIPDMFSDVNLLAVSDFPLPTQSTKIARSLLPNWLFLYFYVYS
jgi:hypothetical protein